MIYIIIITVSAAVIGCLAHNNYYNQRRAKTKIAGLYDIIIQQRGYILRLRSGIKILAHRYDVTLAHSTLRCGKCGRMANRKTAKFMKSHWLCEDCTKKLGGHNAHNG